jgi:hypothetical protein
MDESGAEEPLPDSKPLLTKPGNLRKQILVVRRDSSMTKWTFHNLLKPVGNAGG